jgi:hypothetical protein
MVGDRGGHRSGWPGLLAYGAFLTILLLMVRDLARRRGWRRLAAIGGAVLFFGALVAAFDAIENICLLLTLDGAGWRRRSLTCSPGWGCGCQQLCELALAASIGGA